MKISLSKIEIIIFLIIGAILCVLPYAFTRQSGLVSFDDVGGTIGGVTAPFLSFFGSILVYLALKSQVKANRLIQHQIKKQEEADVFKNRIGLANEKINLLKDEINSFFYLYRDDQTLGGPYTFEYRGSQAIYNLLFRNINTFYGKKKRDSFQLEPKFTELYKLLKLFIQIVQIIHKEEFDKEEENCKAIKASFLFTLNYLFESKIKWNFRSLEHKKSKHEPLCDGNCGLNHGLPEELFDIVDELQSLLINQSS